MVQCALRRWAVVLALSALGFWLAKWQASLASWLTITFPGIAKMEFTFENLFSFGDRYLSPYSQVVCEW